MEAVTLTTMMVALVRICCRFSLFLHLSRLLPSSWARAEKTGGSGTQEGFRASLALHLLGSLLGDTGKVRVSTLGASPASTA